MNQVFIFAFALARMLAVFAMIPIFQQSVLPGAIRTALAMSMVLVVYPSIAEGVVASELPVTTIFALGVKEVVIGILIGFGASTIFWAIEAAGFFIDNQRGSTMASSVDPLTGSQTSPLGIFLTQVLTVFFMVGGGFFVLMMTIYESYQLFPVFEFFPRMDIEGARTFLSIADRIMALAIVMAAPAMIAMFLSEFGLGLVSRFAPQLNVFFLSMPIKSAVGILMLILYIRLLEEIWEDQFALIFTHLGVLRRLLE